MRMQLPQLFRDDTPFPTTDEFETMGRNLSGYQPSTCSYTTRERFVSFFGIEPMMCEIVWKRIINNGSTSHFKEAPNPIHLLWALLFLKTYAKTTVLAAICGCDAKTYRKHAWFYAEAVANLDSQVVSRLCLHECMIMYCWVNLLPFKVSHIFALE